MQCQRTYSLNRVRVFLASLIITPFFLTASVNARETLIASGHPDWPPFTWQQDDRIIGIGAELTKIILDDLGINVIAKARGNWKRVQSEAEYGAIDIIVGIYLTSERTSYLAYPATPYMEDVNVVWVAKGREFSFAKWEDLIGKRGTAMLGESYGESFDNFIVEHLNMERVNAPLQNLKKLELGRSDYYPFSLYGGQIQVARYGYDKKIVHLPGVISMEGAYIAISKKSRFVHLLPELEQAIKKRREDGTIERLVRKYVALAAKSRSRP